MLLVGPPLALAVILWWHPPGGENVYAGVRDDVEAWLFVHTAFLFVTPLLGIAAFILLRGLSGLAATVSRVALVFFLVFYTAYESNVGIGTGVLVDYANGLPAAEQAVVADAIQDYNRNPIITDPSVSLVAAILGWMTAMIAAAVAFRRAGAGWVLTLLVGLAAVFAIHPPPLGPLGLVCFAAAAVVVERARARDAAAFASPPIAAVP
jgi:hypothetical protein